MKRLSLILLCLLSACAPTRVTIPENAGLVTAEPVARLNAKVAVSYRYLSDKVVAKKMLVRRRYGTEISRQEVGSYEIAPATRAIITKALREVFTEVTVIEGKVRPKAYDMIIVPRLIEFDLMYLNNLFRPTVANVEFMIQVLDGQHAKPFGQIVLYGYSKRGVGEHDGLSGEQRAIVRAMEDAASGILTDLPERKMMAPWRAR